MLKIVADSRCFSLKFSKFFGLYAEVVRTLLFTGEASLFYPNLFLTGFE